MKRKKRLLKMKIFFHDYLAIMKDLTRNAVWRRKLYITHRESKRFQDVRFIEDFTKDSRND